MVRRDFCQKNKISWCRWSRYCGIAQSSIKFLANQKRRLWLCCRLDSPSVYFVTTRKLQIDTRLILVNCRPWCCCCWGCRASCLWIRRSSSARCRTTSSAPSSPSSSGPTGPRQYRPSTNVVIFQLDIVKIEEEHLECAKMWKWCFYSQ